MNCITCGTLVFAIYNAQVADRGDTSHAEYKEDESMVKDTAKNEWKGAMGSQLKDSTAKDVVLSMTVLISRTLFLD